MKIRYKGGVTVRTPYGTVSEGDVINVPAKQAKALCSTSEWSKTGKPNKEETADAEQEGTA